MKAGWYPDNDNRDLLRWWDGDAWTQQTHPANMPVSTRADRSAARLQAMQTRAEAKVAFPRATYLGGFSSVRPKKQGNLICAEQALGLGTLNPKVVTVPVNMVASIDVMGGEVAKRKIAATVAFGVLGGLAAKGAKDETVIVVRTTDGEEGYFELDKAAPQEVRAKLGPWMRQHAIPFHEDHVRAQEQRMHGQAVADAIVDRAASGGPSLVDELQRLAALRDTGVLTADEFDRAKARLIGGS